MIAVFIAYLVVLIGIVAYSARRSKTNDDYVLRGKKTQVSLWRFQKGQPENQPGYF